MNHWFHNVKYICGGLAILLFVWMNCKVWIPSFGGQFPYRVRGPLANHDYYKLSEFEDWENFLQVPGSDKLASELLIEAQPIPVLELTRPDAPLPVKSEENTSTEVNTEVNNSTNSPDQTESDT